jgi:hypothetical protein
VANLKSDYEKMPFYPIMFTGEKIQLREDSFVISIRYNVLSVLACVSMLAVNAGVVAPVQEQEVFNPEHLTAKEKINAANQSLLTFIVEGGSLTALMTDPGFGAFFIYEFGMQYPVLNKTLPVKNPADFKNMVPLRKQGFFNYVKQVDFKFDGYRKLKAHYVQLLKMLCQLLGF